jgi:hypothetical protein
MAAKDTSTPAAPIKARVLVSSDYGQPNDVIDIDPDLAATLVGVVDVDAAAVAYAASIAQA